MNNKAIFLRKMTCLEELIRSSKSMSKATAMEYVITRTVELTDQEFKCFTNDFLEDQSWINEGEGGFERYKVKCIEVVNMTTGQAILVNPEGYKYARYTALKI